MKKLFDFKRYLKDKNSVVNVIGKSATKAMVTNSSLYSDKFRTYFKLFKRDLKANIASKSANEIIYTIQHGVFGFRFLQLCKHDYMAIHKTYLKNVAKRMGVNHLLLKYQEQGPHISLNKQINSIKYHVPDKTETKYAECYIEVLDGFTAWFSNDSNNNISSNKALVINLVGKLFINSILYNIIYWDSDNIWNHDVRIAESTCNAYSSVIYEFWKVVRQQLNTLNIVNCVEYYVAHHKKSIIKSYSKALHGETEEMDNIYRIINHYENQYSSTFDYSFLNSIKQISSSVIVVKYFDKLHKFYKDLNLEIIKKTDNKFHHQNERFHNSIINGTCTPYHTEDFYEKDRYGLNNQQKLIMILVGKISIFTNLYLISKGISNNESFSKLMKAEIKSMTDSISTTYELTKVLNNSHGSELISYCMAQYKWNYPNHVEIWSKELSFTDNNYHQVSTFLTSIVDINPEKHLIPRDIKLLDKIASGLGFDVAKLFWSKGYEKVELDIDRFRYNNMKFIADKVTKSSIKPNVSHKVHKVIHHFNLKNWYKKGCRKLEYTLKL